MTDSMLPQPAAPFAWDDMPWGPVLRCRALDDSAVHFFTVRPLSLRGVGAEIEWNQVAAGIGVRPTHLARARQVHGTNVAVASEGCHDARRPEVDALMSGEMGLAVAVQVADCVPVLLADTASGAVAAVHAGWRGTQQGVVEAAVKALSDRFGAEPRHLVAAIGPSIGPCCYEVGDSVREAFQSSHHPAGEVATWFMPGPDGRTHLDLWRANRDQLRRAGLPAAQIHLSRLCTRCHPAIFHSYRAEGPQAGRMLGVIRPR